MSTEPILGRLAEANPAPEHGLEIDDSALLLAIRERSVGMSTTTEKKATRSAWPKEPQRPTGWLIALAAFATVIVVGAVTVLATSRTDTPPASPPTTTQSAVDTSPMLTVAEGLATSFNRGDSVAFQAAFASSSATLTGFDGESGAWDFIHDFGDPQVGESPDSSFGLQIDAECGQVNATTVECTWVPRGGVYDRAGVVNAATAEASMLFNENNEIVRLSIRTVRTEELSEFHTAFGTWLRESHPEVFDATFRTLLVDEIGLESCLTTGNAVRNEAGVTMNHRCLTDTMDGRALWIGVIDEFLAQSDDYPITN